MSLEEQYNKLSTEEKNALNIYKSRLFRFINEYDEIIINPLKKQELKLIYIEYKNIINKQENMFIKMSIFSSIDFSTYDSFLQSIRKIKEVLLGIEGKITLDEDIRLYRMISTDKPLSVIFKNPLISTSKNIDITNNFYYTGRYNYLLSIEVKKGTPCLKIPYSIRRVKEEDKVYLQLKANDSQEEIILFNNTFDYEIISSKYIEELGLKVFKISTNPIKNKTY